MRSLNAPIPVQVRAGRNGHPGLIRRRVWPRPRRVAQVADQWRLDDEWWRERPVSRHYFLTVMEDGLRLTVYHDLIDDTWFEQRDG